MAELQWGLLQSPDFGDVAKRGVLAGAAAGHQQKVRGALDIYAKNPAGAVQALLSAGEFEGAKALESHMKQQQTEALLKEMFKSGATPSADGSPASNVAAPAMSGASPAPPADQGFSVNQDALRQLYAVDPTQAKGVQEFLATADKAQVDRAQRHGETLFKAASYLEKFPAGEARQAEMQRIAPVLLEEGINPQEIAGADLSDGGIQRYKTMGMAYSDLVKQNEPTSTQRELASAGVVPGTPEYRAAILGHVNPDQYMQIGSDATGHQLVQTRGMAVSGVAGAGGASGLVPDAKGVVQGLFPDARVTDWKRDPASPLGQANPGSYHNRTGAAVDVAPIPGMTFDQYINKIKGAGYHVVEALDEATHPLPHTTGPNWHVVIGHEQTASTAPAGAPRVVMSTAPASKDGDSYHLLTPAEKAAAGLDPNVQYQASGKGQITALGGQSRAQLKPIPAPAVQKIIESRSLLSQIDQAEAAIKARPQSIGFGTGMLGDQFTQHNDPEGTTTRAVIGKIAGQVIHDVSGAAVTLSEEPRFKPYVPTVTDSPRVALDKLKQMRQLASGIQQDTLGFYSEEQGYKPFSVGKPAVAAPKGWTVRKIN